MTSNKEECGNCKFFKTQHGTDKRVCMRFPNAEWSNHYDWCGEWTEKVDEPQEAGKTTEYWQRAYQAAHDRTVRYEKALMWYANGGNWWQNPRTQMTTMVPPPAILDGGARALKALSEKEDG